MHARTTTLAALVASFALVGLAQAQTADYRNTAPREQRMNESLQTYRGAAPQQHGADHVRGGDPRNPQPGPAARAEERVKHGARRTGEVIKYGAERTGEAASSAAERTGAAVRRGAERLQN